MGDRIKGVIPVAASDKGQNALLLRLGSAGEGGRDEEWDED